MKTTEKDSLLHLSKEELIHKLQIQAKELALQHNLLKQTFLEYQELKKRFQELEAQMLVSSEGYDASASWVSKIVFTLQKENRPLKSSELITLLGRREPGLKNHHNKAQYFSAFLNTAVCYRRVVQQKVKGVRGYYYLLPDWVDESGNAKVLFKDAMV